MSTRLNPLADRLTGASFGLTNYGNLEADVNYLVVPGADLASAATLNITSRFHGVTGVTSIANILDGLGAVVGQVVEFWIKNGPVTFQNNGGGAGNIRTASGYDRKYAQNAIAEFYYDGTYWRELAPGPAITSGPTPPASPLDGDIWIFPADDTNGVYWQFLYDSAETTYKWRFVGGSPMWAEILTAEATASGTFADLATVGPAITVPRAGDYMVDHGFDLSTTAAATTASMSYDIAGGGAAVADRVASSATGAGTAVPASVMRRRRKTAIAAASALTAKYKSTGGSATFQNRFMSILPVRVA